MASENFYNGQNKQVFEKQKEIQFLNKKQNEKTTITITTRKFRFRSIIRTNNWCEVHGWIKLRYGT